MLGRLILSTRRTGDAAKARPSSLTRKPKRKPNKEMNKRKNTQNMQADTEACQEKDNPIRAAVERLETINPDFKIAEEKAFRTCVPDAQDTLVTVCKSLQPAFKWSEDYAGVVRWLTDNDGKGLIIAGNYGTGKTLIAKALCVIIYKIHAIAPFMVSSADLGKRIDMVKNACRGIVYIDDVGWEQEYVYYGQRFMAFSEVVDELSRKSGLLIASTNFSMEQLKTKYGERVYDRLRGMANVTVFSGQSHRDKSRVL